MERMERLEHQFAVAEADKETRGARGYADLIVLCGHDAPRGMKDLEAAVKSYQPDVLYLDSFYHLDSQRAGKTSQEWSKIQYVAEDIKSLALDMNIPVIGAAQANRLGEKLMGDNLTEMAGSDAIAREADLLIRIVKQKKNIPLNEIEYEGRGRPTVGRTVKVADSLIVKSAIPSKIDLGDKPPRTGAKLALILPGNREGVLDAFTVFAIPGYNFEVDQEHFSSETVAKWVKEDNEETKKEVAAVVGAKPEEPSGKKGRGRRPALDTQAPIPDKFVK
jgi:hypothetical protein